MPPQDTPTPSMPPTPSPMPPAPDANGPVTMPVMGPAPMQPQPVVSGSGSSKMKKPLIIAVAAVVVALLIGGGFVFGFYLPNTPENVYSAGLENTGKAVDALVAYSKTQQSTDYKSVDFDGSFKVKSSDASFDFDINGSADMDSSMSATMNLDLMGNKGSANLRSVKAKGNDTPDWYFQFNGVKQYLDDNGLNSLDNLDGQWISVDHTLIDTYKSQIGDISGGVDPTTAPTSAQIQDAETKVQAVNRQYLFTTNTSTAVLTNEQYLGQTKDGSKTLNHYKVGYNKDHLKAYVKAVGTALDSSTLNDWSKTANKNKNLSDVMDLSKLESDAASAKGDYTFELWVDTSTKLISKTTFTDPEDKSSEFTLSQSYVGGDEYPFGFEFTGKDDSGNAQHFTLNSTLNTKTNKVTVDLDGTSKDDSGTTTITLSLNVTPSKQGVSVTAPTGAKSVTEILNELGLGGLTSGVPMDDPSSDAPLFFAQ